MKKILMLTMLSTIAVSANSQTIAPAENGQYCPLQNITFTVRLPLIEPGTPVTVTTDAGFVPGGGVTVTPYNIVDSSNSITKFNFAGTFGDNNIKQTFKITYTLKGATAQSNKDFSFSYIKSLKNAAPFPSIPNSPCKVLNLGIGSVTVPRCIIQNIPLNFNNVPFSTPTEPNDFCWGKITQYEYQLPNGWSIGGTVSNGSDWIVDDSNVVITSNLGNGDLGKIRVRPSNANCGTGLQNNQLVAEISVSRPEPSFTFTNSAYQICNGLNGVYTINGMPAGSTVVWSVTSTNGTPTTLAQIAGSNTNPTVTVAANATTAGLIKITATVTHCTYIYTPSQTLQIGVGTYPTVRLNYDANCGKLFQAIPYFIAGDGIGTTSFSWNLSGDVNLNTTTTDDLAINPLINNPVNNKTYKVFVKVKAITGCGTSIQNPYIYVVNIGPVNLNACSGGGVLRQLVNSNSVDDNITTAPSFETSNSKISISPNPSNGQFIVVLNAKNKHAGIKQIIVKNKIGIPVYRQTFRNNQQQQNINISGNPTDIYIVEIFDGKQWITQKLSLQR